MLWRGIIHFKKYEIPETFRGYYAEQGCYFFNIGRFNWRMTGRIKKNALIFPSIRKAALQEKTHFRGLFN
jgi:hypothetical protein